MTVSRLTIDYLSIEELQEYGKNAKLHPREQIEQIKKSIEEYGFDDPIAIDENKVIIEGHGRLIAAKELGLNTVPVIYLRHLTEEQKKAYRIAHNKINMNSGFDMQMLQAELKEILSADISAEALGFDEDEIDEILQSIEDEYSIDDITEAYNQTYDERDGSYEASEDEFDHDEAVSNIKEPRTQEGDVWILGQHRLICGDSTDEDVVKRLMNGNKADMVFTDPPYNIGYQGVRDKRTIKNDKMTEEDFLEFLEKGLMVADAVYVCCSWQYSHLFKKALENIGIPPKAMIVWDKVNPAQHLDKYFKQHEIIFYYGKFGGEKTIRGDIWECKRQRNTLHPTMKPIELIAMALSDQPTKKVVYDGFGGSGSTLIACEQLNRACRMVELSPIYCDVIVNRWEALTGKKARKEA